MAGDAWTRVNVDLRFDRVEVGVTIGGRIEVKLVDGRSFQDITLYMSEDTARELAARLVALLKELREKRAVEQHRLLRSVPPQLHWLLEGAGSHGWCGVSEVPGSDDLG